MHISRSAAFSSSGSKNGSRGIPLAPLTRLCRRSLATSVPAKVAGLEDRPRCRAAMAHRLWGDCGLLAKRPTATATRMVPGQKYSTTTNARTVSSTQKTQRELRPINELAVHQLVLTPGIQWDSPIIYLLPQLFSRTLYPARPTSVSTTVVCSGLGLTKRRKQQI